MFYKSIINTTVLLGFILLFLSVSSLSNGLRANPSCHAMAKNDTIATDVPVYCGDSLEPGDTLFITEGLREKIILKNIVGSEDAPIVITNLGGVCEFGNHNNGSYAISVWGSRFFRFTGTGNPEHQYGFVIRDLENENSVGLSMQSLSSDFEIDHFEIYNIGFAGIMAKSDPDTTLTTVRDSFIQYNTHIHHNYIYDMRGGEGMYIGNTKYNEGMNINVDGKDTLLYPHVLVGVRIHDNVVEWTGYDGIQVSSVIEDCEVFNNQVRYDSQLGVYAQMSGIILGGGSRCDCYNNRIEDGLGTGILQFGLGDSKIYNNLIVNAGQGYEVDDVSKRQYGIYMGENSLVAGSGVSFFNNTIVSPRNDGIRIISENSKDNKLMNNLIVDPGAYEEYETDNTAITGQDAYVFTQYGSADIDSSGNRFFLDVENVGFTMLGDNPYSLADDCMLIDAGVDIQSESVLFDIEGNTRPMGYGYDIGAYESEITNYELFPDTTIMLEVYPNPAKTQLTIEYKLEEESDVSILLLNSFGVVIRDIENATKTHGTYSTDLSISSVESGVYLLYASINEQISTQVIMVLN